MPAARLARPAAGRPAPHDGAGGVRRRRDPLEPGALGQCRAIAWIARAVPALGLELPPTAVGKDFLGERRLVAATPSGTGGQVSLFGVLGAALARAEGLEVHILGLTFGIDPLRLAIKLPGVGRLGRSTAPGE